MANQPLAIAELLAGGILVAAALTGSSLKDVVAGNAGPFKGFANALGGNDTASASTGGGSISGALIGSPIAGEKPHAPTHQTLGLPGYPAFDYLAPAGTPVVAPVSGTITRLSGSDPSKGPSQGIHGPFGLSAYLQGDDGKIYYLTHLGSLLVKAGQRVKQGTEIATVGNYAKWGGVNHVHVGVHG